MIPLDTFPDIVRKRRKEKGITIRALADEISKRPGVNVSRSHLNFVETGRHLPSYEVAVALAQALEIDEVKALRAAYKARVEYFKNRENDYLEKFLKENKRLNIEVGRISK